MVVDKIRQVIELNKITIDEFAERIGEKPTRLKDVLREKQRPPLEMIQSIVENFQIDANWLIGLSDNFHQSGTKNEGDYDYVPMFDVEVSAGNGASAYGVTDPAMHLAFRKDWLKSRGLFAKDLNCVVARGDSMEPTINSKDTLLVDTSKNHPRDGQIYVIRSGDTLWVKRIQKQIDGSLLLISDNDTYPPMSLTLADHPDIQVIGQVVQISKDLS
ncbi:helix-turn-helix transcriptional regulator [Neisseria weixii]|uniref:LexA family transcriptional regulator n=1 Tax=Neisseria weixii TaxID=1853276 RepID=UPI000BB7C849|nr:S24 family peptidase [Neisseria weixii]ATD64859.1 Cro/Cl family transcriptional regulator [Neisseria weixii]